MNDVFSCEAHGSGTPLVLIHGLGGTANVFGPQVGALSRHFRCLRPELPGSGRSAARGAMSLKDLADQFAVWLEQQALGAAHLVGHSMGTIICQHLAVLRPDLVRSLALIGPLLEPSEPARNALRDRATKARTEGMLAIADAIVASGTSADTKSHRPEVAAFVREILMRQDPEGYAFTCEALAAAKGAKVSEIACPVLLLTGDEDATAPPLAVRSLAAKLAKASLLILDRCGHWAPLERSREVNHSLSNFLLPLG